MLKFIAILLALVAALLAPVRAAETLTIGLIATNTVEQVLDEWRPLADALARELGQPVRLMASKQYEDVAAALKEGRVQVAWINNKLAIELVEHDIAHVFSQMVRLDGARGYKSVLMVRRDGPVQSLQDLLSQPGRLRLGTGDRKSTSGFLVPDYYVFAKNKVDWERHFAKVSHANHLDNFLALAEGRADVVTNNTEQLPRYEAEHAARYAAMKVIWESPLIPNDPLLMRKDVPGATQQKVKRFFAAYGRSEAEKATLKAINGLSAFKPSTDFQLRPVVELELFQALARSMAADASGAQFQAVVKGLTERAARLDTLMNAARLD